MVADYDLVLSLSFKSKTLYYTGYMNFHLTLLFMLKEAHQIALETSQIRSGLWDCWKVIWCLSKYIATTIFDNT